MDFGGWRASWCLAAFQIAAVEDGGGEGWWRPLFFDAAAPAVVLAVGAYAFAQESPVWLLTQNDKNAAETRDGRWQSYKTFEDEPPWRGRIFTKGVRVEIERRWGDRCGFFRRRRASPAREEARGFAIFVVGLDVRGTKSSSVVHRRHAVCARGVFRIQHRHLLRVHRVFERGDKQSGHSHLGRGRSQRRRRGSSPWR